jgi:CHAT domain-containing protein
LEPVLIAQSVQTLVIVPDGPLRTIPLSALHDGRQLLVERYALATTPGLSLMDPQPLKRDQVQLLLNGLSEAVQGYPALPNVPSELTAIKALYPSTLLINKGFVMPAMQAEIDRRPYNMVHIATHDQFGRDPHNTFLLTFNDRLTMDRLEQFLAPSQFRETPVELLTLSACETTSGDDRAALGLAGVAIKAGARSALASLWSVNDKSTSLLMTEFYQQLKGGPSLSKAQALKKAQLKILQEHDRYKHPFFWSPFLLIGNWL